MPDAIALAFLFGPRVAEAIAGYNSLKPGADKSVPFFVLESTVTGVVKYNCLVSSSLKAFSIAVWKSQPAFMASAAKVRMALSYPKT